MTEWLDVIPYAALVGAVMLIVGLESIGLPLPGETVLITALLIAVHDGMSPWWIMLAAMVGAIVGDNIGYLIGRTVGIHLLEFGRRRLPAVFSTERIVQSATLMARYGAWAVFFARFVAVLRILAGPLAGTLRMHWGRFLLANSAGAVAWAGTVTLVVVSLGEVAEELMHRASWVALVLAALVAVAAVTVFLVRRRRRRRDPQEAAAEDADERTLIQILNEVQDRHGRHPHGAHGQQGSSPH